MVPKTNIHGLDRLPCRTRPVFRRNRLCQMAGKSADGSRNGNCARAADWTALNSPGATFMPDGICIANTWRAIFRHNL